MFKNTTIILRSSAEILKSFSRAVVIKFVLYYYIKDSFRTPIASRGEKSRKYCLLSARK